MARVAVDFGTTNTIVAIWREAMDAPETIRLPGLCAPATDTLPPMIPSLVYVADGAEGEVIVGHNVRAGGYDVRADDRFFASFKRGIGALNQPLARIIDDHEWDEARAGGAYLAKVLQKTIQREAVDIEELVLTVPVQSFEQYLNWLKYETENAIDCLKPGIRNIRVVDESTAAALGYQLQIPGEVVLVFDFGGGTLDVSLVRMPSSTEGAGLLLQRGNVRRRGEAQYTGQTEARVIAKAGRVLGGDDIDHWLLAEVLARNGLTQSQIGDSYARLKAAVERAKVRLSNHEDAEVSVFDPDTSRTVYASFSRTQLEQLLDQHQFYSMVQKTINKTLRTARTAGIFPEDISAAIMVGGTSQIPSVQRMVRGLFGGERVFEDKPYEAVAHGALALSAGLELDDFLYHSYCVRHLDPSTNRHEWEEIIPAGTRYPLEEPVSLILSASIDAQEVLELVIGEVEDKAGGTVEVMFGDRAILLVDNGAEWRKVIPLNGEDGASTVAYLDPPGRVGEDRVEVKFNVDQNRMLRVQVNDLYTRETLLYDAPVVELR
jgi:molecular chaperone DnaK (HSP70)